MSELTPEKNRLYTVTIEGCTSEGQGVARIGGRAVFVKGALPGEECRVRIVKAGGNAVYARVEELRAPAPGRVAPDCPHFGKCGGCDYRHADYALELELKLRRVNDAFARIGGLALRAETILGAAATERYRAKAIFAVGQDVAGKAATGFYRARSHALIPVEDCRLQTREANRAAAALRRYMDENRVPAYDEGRGRGLVRHLFVRAGMVCVVSAAKLPAAEKLVSALREACPELTSIISCVNRAPGNTVLTGVFETLWGTDSVDVELGGLTFRLSPRSFFQVNPAQAARLYAKAIAYAALTGTETVVDLYCGAGAIGLLAAGRAGEIAGVELVAEAVADARDNAARNGIQNARFLCADAAEAAARFASEGLRPDVLFVDPPRKGLEVSVVEAAARMAPARIVYVSCDPATLARDLKRFSDFGYAAEAATAVDMFPRTCHVETVCLLSKLRSDHHIEVNLNLDEMDLTAPESKATYEEIKAYVLEHSGFKVSSLYISQVKRKLGLEVGANYNLPKSEGSKQPQCPADKEKAIITALKHYKMI